jgi:hypothetical protein
VAAAPSETDALLMDGVLKGAGIPSLIQRAAGFDVPDFLTAGPKGRASATVRWEIAVSQPSLDSFVRAGERFYESRLCCTPPENRLGWQTLDARFVAGGLQGELRSSHAHLD